MFSVLNILFHRRGWSWYAARTPRWLQACYPSLTWHVPIKNKVVYLTFDDGPIPIVTPFVLQTLKRYRAKAHFFCIGKNVTDNPNIYTQLLTQGHVVGNHSHNHLNGWKTPTNTYCHNVQQASTYINSKLYRPPYGRITRAQIKILRKQYRIIMWGVLSGDFDTSITAEKCYHNVITNISAGCIIVFHDSKKAYPHLQVVLPKVLLWLQNNGYTTALLPSY